MWKKHKWAIIIVGIIIVLGIVLMLLRGDEDTWIKDSNGNWVKHGNPTEVTDFNSCAKYFPVMETYPERCNTPDGKSFTKEY